MNLSTFIVENCGNIFKVVQESILSRDVNKAQELIKKFLLKSNIFTLPSTTMGIIDGQRCQMVEVFKPDKNLGAAFIWEIGNTSQIKAIGFTRDFNQTHVDLATPDLVTKWDVYVESKGTNVVQMCKLAKQVLTGKVSMEASSIRQEIRASQLFESRNPEVEDLIMEGNVDPVIADLTKKKNSLYHKIRNANNKGTDVSKLEKEYKAICDQLADAKTSIRKNVAVKTTPDPDVEKLETNFFDSVRATPEERFGDMKNYIYNVIAGIRPLALLCGAPGIGKTYRVMQAVKGTGKQQGVDYKLLKGKCTPTALYMALHDFKDEGQLLIIDDCDSIFQDNNAINLLKAAYDSSDERWVTWSIASWIPMDDETAANSTDAVIMNGKPYYPKEFQYKGGCIIITNYTAGQIDTAVRNRALICDLNFTTHEILDLIEGIAPQLQPNVLTDKAKSKAMKYLRELADAKAPVELSIRSFTLCAGLFASDCPESQVKRMINEQMKLNFLRGGKKY